MDSSDKLATSWLTTVRLYTYIHHQYVSQVCNREKPQSKDCETAKDNYQEDLGHLEVTCTCI